MSYMEYENQKTHSIGSFMYAVYAWMAAALSVTAVVAYAIASRPDIIQKLYTNSWLLVGLFIAQIALVMVLSSMIQKLSFPVALVIFFSYAGLMGLTLSSVFYIYTLASIGTAFATTAIMFGGMALYGYMTKSDLSTMGSIVRMALWGLIVAMLINMYFKNPAFDMVISGIGVLIFSLLTAYDTQRIKSLLYQVSHDNETMNKITLLGALMLYLDFINLFLYLLRFVGNKRND